MKHHADTKRLLMWLRLMRLLRIGAWQAVVIQSVMMGLAGALAALCFERAADAVQYVYTGMHGGRVACFMALSAPWRLLLPALGAIPAALVLYYALRHNKKPVPEYMEAFSLGNGRLPRRQGVLRSLSAVLSLGSGACIGKEGALMQISAVSASAMGRWLHVSPPRLRLMVGCGAAAGMTAAYHTPLAACLFVCEIVVGTFSIGTLAPLLVASCAAYMLITLLGCGGALFPTQTTLCRGADIALCAVLALGCALLARFWVYLLDFCRRWLNGKPAWLLPRMVAAGLLVGAVAVWEPEIVGNGQESIADMVQGFFGTERIATLLVLKVVMVAIVFGVGTMGGVLTPTLMIGCCIGALYGAGVHALGWGSDAAIAFAFVGMAAFFAVAGRAPVTALLLAVELTMNAALIFPLMVGVALAYAFSRLLPGKSLYDASTHASAKSAFDSPMADMHVADIYRRSPMRVHENTPVERVLRVMLRHPGENVPVQDAQGHYLGLILSEKLSVAGSATHASELSEQGIQVLTPDMSLPQALECFTRSPTDSLPVVRAADSLFLGMLSRGELYQVAALMMRKELARTERS